MYKVIFSVENNDSVESYANEGENLLEVARKSNVAIDAPCLRQRFLRQMPNQTDKR